MTGHLADGCQWIDLEAGEDGSTTVLLHQWVDPPRASARANNYPPELRDEFNEFIAAAEAHLVKSAKSIIETDHSLGL